jgi:hypothetical protein
VRVLRKNFPMRRKVHQNLWWNLKLFAAIVAKYQTALAHTCVLLRITRAVGFAIDRFSTRRTKFHRGIAAPVIHIRAADFIHFAARLTATTKRLPSQF